MLHGFDSVFESRCPDAKKIAICCFFQYLSDKTVIEMVNINDQKYFPKP